MTQMSYRDPHCPFLFVQQAVSMDVRCNLSLRDVGVLLAACGVEVSCEAIRRGVATSGVKFNPVFSPALP